LLSVILHGNRRPPFRQRDDDPCLIFTIPQEKTAKHLVVDSRAPGGKKRLRFNLISVYHPFIKLSARKERKSGDAQLGAFTFAGTASAGRKEGISKQQTHKMAKHLSTKSERHHDF